VHFEALQNSDNLRSVDVRYRCERMLMQNVSPLGFTVVLKPDIFVI